MFLRLVLILACVPLSGCAVIARHGWAKSPPSHESVIQQAAFDDSEDRCVVYVMSNGFHSGMVMRRRDISSQIWPELDQMPDHDWVEVGWGSEIFYRAKKITPQVVLGALCPNPSVLHIVGWDEAPTEIFPGDLVRLEIDPAHFQELCQYIRQSYRLDGDQQPEDLGEGIYGDSRFFRARGLYYFPKTCNVWTARGLAAAGVPIVPEMCSTADAVMAFAGRTGTVVQHR